MAEKGGFLREFIEWYKKQKIKCNLTRVATMNVNTKALGWNQGPKRQRGRKEPVETRLPMPMSTTGTDMPEAMQSFPLRSATSDAVPQFPPQVMGTTQRFPSSSNTSHFVPQTIQPQFMGTARHFPSSSSIYHPAVPSFNFNLWAPHNASL